MGGLGLRSAQDLALPAFLGSRASSRPLVAQLLKRVDKAGLCDAAALMRLYDARTDAAVANFVASLPPAVHGAAKSAYEDCMSESAGWWHQLFDDRNSDCMPPGPDSAAQRHAGRVSAGLVADAGAEDPEHPWARGSGPRGQRILCKFVDESLAAGLAQHATESADLFSLARLEDLRHETTDHTWLWNICEQTNTGIHDQEEYVEAVRVRLGCGGLPDPSTCRCCGVAPLDSNGAHASICAIGEATRGHNAIKEIIFDTAHHADPQAELEAKNIVPSRPGDRPADVLTAASGCLAALDVGVTSPASAWGADAAEKMWERKRGERAGIERELLDQGITYMPVVFTCFGRMHPEAVRILNSIGARAARRRGWAVAAVRRQLHSRIGAALARRAARMSLAACSSASSSEIKDLCRQPAEYDDLLLAFQ